MKPLCIDLFCGLGGWAEGFLSEGYGVVGFDIERHDYGTGGYLGQLVLQDVLTLDGSQFRDAAVIVASPPCQFFSYTAMPWSRAKALAAAVRSDPVRLEKELALFKACFRIAVEAGVPLVVENVVGAQAWVGRAKWHYGSFYLWGDVPALMPFSGKVLKGRSNFHFYEQTGLPSPSFHGHAEEPSILRHDAIKNNGGSWFNQAHNTDSGCGQNPDGRKIHDHLNISNGHSHTRHLTNQGEHGVKQNGSGPVWFDTGIAQLPSGSSRRKAASAQIAKIPFPLAQWIARCYKPAEERTA